jgi:hypothetical protein
MRKRKLTYSAQKFSPASVDGQPEEEGDTPPPTRRQKYHEGKSCGRCSVLETLGDPEENDLEQKHAMGRYNGHPNEKAAAFNAYLSVRGMEFKLNADSCMCNSCYRDCNISYQSENKPEPRWVNIHHKGTGHSTSDHHCPICHFESDMLQSSSSVESPCKATKHWISKGWRQGFSVSFWKKYFIHTRSNFNCILNESSMLCHAVSSCCVIMLCHHVVSSCCVIGIIWKLTIKFRINLVNYAILYSLIVGTCFLMK